VLSLSAEVAPEHQEFFKELQEQLPPRVTIVPASKKTNENIVEFPNPQTRRRELRILDTRLGIYVPFPRSGIFALFMGQT
jgi:hypothetical protein